MQGPNSQLSSSPAWLLVHTFQKDPSPPALAQPPCISGVAFLVLTPPAHREMGGEWAGKRQWCDSAPNVPAGIAKPAGQGRKKVTSF